MAIPVNKIASDLMQRLPFRNGRLGHTQAHAHGEAVLVTGCSSGIGRAIATHLAQSGFTVLATVRQERDAESLRGLQIPSLVPICPLDLSSPDHIPGLVETVRRELTARGLKGLYAIVNNAGGGFIAPVELMDLARFRAEFETRVAGPVALVQSLLPMIRAAHGRILWISTPGLVAIPYVSSIHTFEFAVHCIAQTLHLELTPWNIPNVFIGCGGVRSAAPERTAHELDEAMQRWPAEKVSLYALALRRVRERFNKFDTDRSDPIEVARVVETALIAEHPRRRYLVAHQAAAMAALQHMPQAVVDFVFRRVA